MPTLAGPNSFFRTCRDQTPLAGLLDVTPENPIASQARIFRGALPEQYYLRPAHLEKFIEEAFGCPSNSRIARLAPRTTKRSPAATTPKAGTKENPYTRALALATGL